MAEDPNVNTGNPGNDGGEKTFTQAEVDNIVGKRLAKAMKGMPSEDELKAYKTWQANHKDDEGTIATLTRERDEANGKVQQYEREKHLLSLGVPADDVDYYSFKIGKLVDDKTDFKNAAENYFKENPLNVTRVDLGGNVGGGDNKPNPNDAMNNLIRGIRK